MTSGSLRLRVSAEASHLAIARAFIGSSLRILEQPDTTINDLRLAVSELLTVLVLEELGPIDLMLSVGDEALLTSISGPSRLPPIPPDIADLVGRLTNEGLDLQEESWVIRTSRQ